MAVIVRIVYDIRYYLVVLFCVLSGFAQAFWLMSNVDPKNDFGTVRNALYTAYMTMLGGYDPNFDGSVSVSFSSFLLCVFMMAMVIVMLNILIALMSDTFSQSRSQVIALWQREKATIIFDQLFLVSDNSFWKEMELVYRYYYPVKDEKFEKKKETKVTKNKPIQSKERKRNWWMRWWEPEKASKTDTFAHIQVLKYTSDVQLKDPKNALEGMVEESQSHVRNFTKLK